MPFRYTDLSHSLEEATPVYPDYPSFTVRILERASETSLGGQRLLNSSHFAMGMHCGTHMDSPYHFYSNGESIDQVPIEQCTGKALLLPLRDLLPNGRIEKSDLKPYEQLLCEYRKVILNTGWSRFWKEAVYFLDHPVITGEAARFLVDCGIHLVGLDTPSVDHSPFEAHLTLLGHGVVILENLTHLDQILSQVFHLIALPLKLKRLEASPGRAIAMEVSE